VAVNVKKGVTKSTLTMADFLDELQKDKGEEIGSFGGKLVESDRIPTGIFPLDLAMAGGFPRGSASTIFGPESSGKTNIALRAIAMHQLLWPNEVCAFFDVENSLDPLWARRLGVQTSKLLVIKPQYGEQMVDMVESAMLTDDCGLVVIDSVAAILTTSEAEASAERATVGGNSILVGKLVRKSTNAMMQASKRNRHPSVFYINQVRSRVGVVYGNPEIMPGGNAPRFQSNIVLRVYGKNLIDAKISSVMPVIKDTKFVMAKWKCPVLTEGGTFQMVMVPHSGLKVGQCDDFNTVSEYLKAFGQFEKDVKKGWLILGEQYDTIAPFKKKIYEDTKFGSAVRAMIIERNAKTNELLQEKEYEATADEPEVAS
jgi:recombination protein RecA